MAKGIQICVMALHQTGASLALGESKELIRWTHLPQSGQTLMSGSRLHTVATHLSSLHILRIRSHRQHWEVPLLHRSCLYKINSTFGPIPPFWNFIFSVWRAGVTVKDSQWFLAVQGSWLACMYDGGSGYSHSMIFKAGAVICEISTLASENLS